MWVVQWVAFSVGARAVVLVDMLAAWWAVRWAVSSVADLACTTAALKVD